MKRKILLLTATILLSVASALAQSGQCGDVTVTENNLNQIVWEKQENVAFYRIYREKMQSGNYELVTSINATNPNIWQDTQSNPKAHSNRYKMALVDECNFVTELSPAHRTMYLTINPNENNAWDLSWNAYESLEHSWYRINRATGTAPLEWRLIDSIPSNNTSYTDFSAPQGNVYYEIEIPFYDACGSGLYSIKSNIASNTDEIPKYSVFVNANNNEFGTVAGGGVFDRNTSATVFATPSCGYKFANWTKWGEVVSIDNPYSFIVTEDVELVANFEAEEIVPTLNFNSYVITKWNNTFMLNLNKLAAHGYVPTECKWYENGILLGEGFTFSLGDKITDQLKAGAVYTFMLCTDTHGTLFSTEKGNNVQQGALQVYPNPLPQGNKLTIRGTTENSTVEVYNMYGMCVHRTTATGNITEIVLDVSAGFYVVRSNNEQVKVIIQ